MAIRRIALAAVAAGALVLTACGNDDNQETGTTTATSAPATTQASAQLPGEVSKVLGALEELDAEYTEPSEEEPEELSGAEQRFALDIVGYSAAITLFTDADSLDAWQEASEATGGVSVTFDTTAVALNSDEGEDASLALAPQLAEKLGGQSHIGSDAPDMTPSGEVDAAADAPVAEPDPATIPFADGGTCAAAVCGYGHDEDGNRNPSSGEIQGRHGCQSGYIDDPEYCAAIEGVFEANNNWQ